jgi:tRNA dimethylallyltransferase
MLIVICGATASGKSGLGLNLAQRLNTVILSADSRQVYRDFNIGTAKPTREERLLIPHYLLDICDPTETLTVADYQDQAQNLINSMGFPLLMVGGTGLYIKSITQGMKIPRVAPNLELRSQLSSLGQVQLYAMLQQIDAIAAGKIHSHDHIRTLRALEVYYVTGKPISAQQGEHPPDYPILQIGLDCDLNDLEQRIAQRTDLMLAECWLEEVEFLMKKYPEDLPLMDTLGYQEMREYIRGKISLETAKELTILHTRQFAKRQRTWFKSVKQIEWYHANDPQLLEQVWLRITEFLEQK